MSIVIQIANTSPLSNKYQRLLNHGLQVAENAAIAEIRKQAYQGVMVGEWEAPSNQDLLHTPSNQVNRQNLFGISNIVNNVILANSAGRIEFINAKIDVKKSNKIQSTSLINRSGSVNEYIREEAYVITIKGDIIAKRYFPHEELVLLNQILTVPEPMEIASEYLRIFDISKVILSFANFNQSTAKQSNTMPYSINLQSDYPVGFLVDNL